VLVVQRFEALTVSVEVGIQQASDELLAQHTSESQMLVS